MTATLTSAPGRGSTFSSLRVRNYRLYASGQIVSLAGTWMQRVAQDWLVLDLSGGSATALGIAAALQFGPTLVLSLWGGVLADRVDKRRALIALQAAMGLCALVLGTAVVTGVVALWHVYLLCLLLGCFSALDVPVRQSFVPELVGDAQLGNAVALNSLTFNLARIVGPSLAGVLIAVTGTGWVFLINAVSFAAVITGLALMDPARLHRVTPVPRAPGQLRAGLRYVRGRPDLVAVLALVFLVSTFGINFYLTLALLARSVFGLGADAYGLLTSLLAVGSVAGAVLAARRVRRPRLRLVTGSALAFGVLVVLAGLMPTFLLTGIVMVPLGFAALMFTTAANSAVQLSVEPAMRGRVMGLYILLFLGGTPVGAPLLGMLAESWGGRSPLVLGGVVTVVSVLVVTVVLVMRAGGPRTLLRREERLG
ncbi:MFS transporter [Pseudonocardia sp. KRD-184]|uniref:MFS transporter n=1 Tax=Pseudonocardia oceani TaxID=2792013 RepID=A0ABS6UBZ3_9PSEU|nr:MFS transporter [Pseudonocardia oceani]MBW0089547.1 MFS transporter [Pseudonocardia oceani]MBW0096612.1 MFS transporter [Pseudonocardia oceani]MBW0109303.1 MFS transporter [Pseudonocardia oceani]MBW0123468.1 MFS transporter [Pseudonocardia oceani]MBW0129389.1 MFS transporter [Pseudonocardia oceani]